MTIDAIIGVGGAGGWLCQLAAKSSKEDRQLWIVDGDDVTESNLSRQFYGPKDLNKKKTKGMMRYLKSHGVNARDFPEYLAYGGLVYSALRDAEEPLRIFACPDNHACRVLCMGLADERFLNDRQTFVVVCGNEYTTASADAYDPLWEGTDLDMRVRYPEMRSDARGDPLRPGCTGEILESAPQLALFNSLSALSGAWLMRIWSEVEPARREDPLYAELYDNLPVSVQWTATGQRTLKVKELKYAD
jgi:hypothetical protein